MIRRKLQRASMLASVTALGSAASAFIVDDMYTFRSLLVARVGTEAQILASNCVSPLLFDDAETATTTLAGLKAESHALSAGVYGKTRRLFASYARPGEAPPEPEVADGTTS